jgi:hypothetical protein
LKPETMLPLQRIPPVPPSPKSQALEYVKALGPIAVAVVAAFQQHGAPFWALFGFAVLGFGVALYEPLRRAVLRRRRRRHDDAGARRAVPELERLVRRFREIVDGDRNDTLHTIIMSGLQNNQAALVRLMIPSGHWFRSFVDELLIRLRDKPTGLNYLLRAAGEFHTIVHAYGNQCLSPIFEQLPVEDRQLLVSACGRPLEAFRQRYMNFRTDYEKYVNAVLSDLHSTPPLHGELPRTQPLM